MRKQIIRLTENDLHNIIKRTVNKILRENFEDEKHVLKLKNQEPPMDDMPPIGGMEDSPIDEPPMGVPEPNNPPMGNPPMESNEEPPMGENDPSDGGIEEPPMENEEGGETQEIDDIFNELDTEDRAAVIKYAKSMADDNGIDSENNGMAMENKKHSYINRIIEDILDRDIRGKDRELKRPNKDLPYDEKDTNPFISKR